MQCLDENFKNFTDEACFLRDQIVTTNVDNTCYNFKFSHDWPFHGLQVTDDRHKGQLQFIKQKYARRIARFDNLRHYKGKVFFIRCLQTHPEHKGEHAWNAQNAQKLNEALKRFFPELNFTLVIVSGTDPHVSEIGYIEGVKEFKIRVLTNFSEYKSMYDSIIQQCMSYSGN